MRKVINLIVAVLLLVSCSSTKTQLKEALKLQSEKTEELQTQLSKEMIKNQFSIKQVEKKQYGDTLQGSVPVIYSLEPVTVTAKSNGVDLVIKSDSTGISYTAIAKPVAKEVSTGVFAGKLEENVSGTQKRSSKNNLKVAETKEVTTQKKRKWISWYWYVLLAVAAIVWFAVEKYTKPVSFLVKLYNLIFKTKTRE